MKYDINYCDQSPCGNMYQDAFYYPWFQFMWYDICSPPPHTHKQKLKRHKDSNFSNAQGYYSHVTYGKSQLFIAHFSYTSMDYFEAKRSAAFYFEIH